MLVLRLQSKAGQEADRWIARIHLQPLCEARSRGDDPPRPYGQHAIATIQQVSDEAGSQQCSFCGKRRYQVAAMASADDARIICNECLELCGELASEEPPAS